MSLGGSNPSPSATYSRRQLRISIWPLTVGTDRTAWNLLGWSAFALACLLLAAQALRQVDPQDEGQFLTYPWLIAHGWMPYRDIWMSYPPAMYLILAALVKLGLPALIAERSLGVLVRIAYVLLINRLVAGAWARFSCIGVSVAYGLLFLASDVKTSPWIMALPLFVLGLALTQDRPFVSAALFSAAGFFRFEYAAAGLLALAVLGLLAGLRSERWRAPGLAALFLVALTGALYLLGDLMTAGNLVRDAVADQVGAVERARYIALWPPPFSLLGAPVLVLILVGPAIVIVAALMAALPRVAATNLAVLTLTPHFVQRADSSHLFQTGLIVIPWLVVSLVQIGEQARSQPRLRSFAGVGLGWIGLTVGAWCTLIVIAYAIYLSPLLPGAGQSAENVSQRLVQGNGNATVAISTAEARDDRQVVGYLNARARPGDGVLIIPRTLASQYTRTDLYSLLAVRPCTRYLEVQGGSFTSAGAQREMVRDLPRCTWVVELRGGAWYNPFLRAAPLPLERAIRGRYRAVLADNTYRILRRVAS